MFRFMGERSMSEQNLFVKIERIVNGYLIIYDIGNGEQKIYASTFPEAIDKSNRITKWKLGGDLKNDLQNKKI